MLKKTLLISALAVATSSLYAHAEGTLDKIKASNTMVLAYRDASVPFSYTATDPHQPVGFSHDLSLKIFAAVKKELNMPNLGMRYNLVTSQNRIPLVMNGTVDLECGSTTNNASRAQQVQFSDNFFEIGTRLLVNKASGIKDFPDLKGKRAIVVAGTTSEKWLQAHKDELGIAEIFSARNGNEAFLMLQNGRGDAFMIDDILLAGQRSRAKDPSQWEIVGTPATHESYGCMMRKGDPAFQKVVNDTLVSIFHSDEINTLYKKWFESPIPPKNVNLDFPMSAEVKALYTNPTDKPAE